MDEFVVRVWRRFNHFRLYVTCGEAKVGWYDVRSGVHELEPDADVDAFWRSVRAECLRLGEEEPGPAKAEEQLVAPVVEEEALPVRDDRDLAFNRAGAAAAARAEVLRGRESWWNKVAGVFGGRSEARDFAFGAKGERVVGKKLERWAQRGGWHVLHAVPVGTRGADIDHVLIGAFGVVTVNTKATRGRVWVSDNGMVVSGAKVDYLRNSRHEAERARELLGKAFGRHVSVHPVIVFVGAGEFTVKAGGPKDVAVVRDVKALRRWLRRRGRVLRDGDVEALYELARNPATWQR